MGKNYHLMIQFSHAHTRPLSSWYLTWRTIFSHKITSLTEPRTTMNPTFAMCPNNAESFLLGTLHLSRKKHSAKTRHSANQPFDIRFCYDTRQKAKVAHTTNARQRATCAPHMRRPSSTWNERFTEFNRDTLQSIYFPSVFLQHSAKGAHMTSMCAMVMQLATGCELCQVCKSDTRQRAIIVECFVLTLSKNNFFPPLA